MAAGGVLTNAGGGVLTVTNLGPALAAGDIFQLFNQALPNGGALTVNPATPGPSLRWANRLAIDGTLDVLAVATNPVCLGPSLDQGILTLSWPEDHTGWRLQVQTNLAGAGLGTNWVDVSGASSTNQFLWSIGRAGALFFRLVYP